MVFVPHRRSKTATTMQAAGDNGLDFREVHESCSCAVRFARERAADYGGDPARVTVCGDKLAALQTALIGDDLQALWGDFAALPGGPPPQTDCLSDGVTVQVDAYVACGGDYRWYEVLNDSDPEQWAMTSPFALIGRNPELPLHIFHGEEASPTNVERAVEYHEALVNAGYDAKLTPLPEAAGEIPWSGPSREALIQAILAAAQH